MPKKEFKINQKRNFTFGKGKNKKIKEFGLWYSKRTKKEADKLKKELKKDKILVRVIKGVENNTRFGHKYRIYGRYNIDKRFKR